MCRAMYSSSREKTGCSEAAWASARAGTKERKTTTATAPFALVDKNLRRVRFMAAYYSHSRGQNMKTLVLPIFVLLAVPSWTVQTSGVTARLRGVSAVSERVAWASGSGSTVLRTDDDGTTWKKITVTGDALDFRDIDAIDEQTAYVLSIGNGSASRIYKTIDGGASWTLQFRNDDPKVFLDAMTFWDADHGVVIGDSVDLKFYILMTSNGGRDWTRVAMDGL